MLQPGDTLAGYRVESVIGFGGMGVVYRATQMSLERQVALKVLSTTLVGNRSFRERFRREGRHAAALDHPNIIPVYEAGEANGLMFIAMRLVDGPTLGERMVRGDLGGRDAMRILRAIASALDRAHGAGLVHRDVKPQNVLVDRSGHAYLADFGVTKGGASDGLTRTGDFVGSLSYAAPEQMQGGALTPACDVYALACVLHQCLTGAVPFERETDAAVMHAHLHEPPPSLRARGLDAPPQLDAVLARGMAKAPEERYATAMELIDAADAALQHLPPGRLDGAPPLPLPQADEELEDDGFRVAAPAAPLAEATYAERRRDTGPAPAPAPPRRDRRRVPPPAGIAAVAVLAIAAPIGGFAVAGGGGGEAAAPRTERSGALELTVDGAWERAPVQLAGLELEDGLSLEHPSGARLVAGRVAAPGPVADPAPAAFRETWADGGEPVVLRLGELRAIGYDARLGGDRRVRLAMIPTDRGWVAAACASDAGAGPCEPALAGLALNGARPLPPGPDAEIGAKLDEMARGLSAERARSRKALASRRAAGRAAAAERLQRRHAAAAREVRGLKSPLVDPRLIAALAKALAREAEAFEDLGSAARRRDRAAYRRAAAEVRAADAALAKAFRALETAGYAVG